MALSNLTFDKDWTNPSDFPTVETNEADVRADIQYLFNAIKTYINGTLKTFVDNLQSGSGLTNGSVTESKLATVVKNKLLGSSRVITDYLADGAVTEDKLASGAVTTEKIADEAVTYAKASGLQKEGLCILKQLTYSDWTKHSYTIGGSNPTTIYYHTASIQVNNNALLSASSAFVVTPGGALQIGGGTDDCASNLYRASGVVFDISGVSVGSTKTTLTVVAYGWGDNAGKTVSLEVLVLPLKNVI